MSLACVAAASTLVLNAGPTSDSWYSLLLRGYLTPMWIVRVLEVRLGLPRLGVAADAIIGLPVLLCPYLLADAIWRAIIGPVRLASTY